MSTQPTPPPEPTVVGIGASAGGLAALKIFLDHVPADSGLALVVVVHLSPNHESHLAELLQPHGRFPVIQVTETIPLEPNHVYVIPPNANLSTIDTHLRLSKLEERRQERAPIDHFFRTLAATHDGNSIAVILTGTGSDGTLGVKEIKARGGLVIVQDPKEAEYDGMPQSAIATGLVDLVLPLAEIPENILRFARTEPRLLVPKDGEEVPQDERAMLQKMFAQLRARTDRDFSRYKRSTVLRRVARRMQLNYVEDLSSYLENLQERPEEVRALADDLLITVTDFFRDPEVFERLEKVEIPQLFSRKSAQHSIRVWSVGCSTGEEAYSLAILLREAAERQAGQFQIQLFGSDLHSRSLAKAREGFYPGDIETNVSPERLKRYFIKENGGYRIQKEIRDMVVFAPHNLLADPPFSRLDLISCRNLLIYLEREVQHDVVELFHYALNPEGLLVLGPAETIDSADLFRSEDKKLCFFRKRNVPTREPRLPVFPLMRSRLSLGLSNGAMEIPDPVAYGSLHQRMVEQYAPPSILISPDDKIVHFSEHAGRYLVHPGGEPTSSAVKLVREELRIELQASVQGARDRKEAFDSLPIPVRFDGDPRPVVLHVRPALEAEREGFVLVIFEEREPRPANQPDPAGEGNAARISELETDLGTTRQRLQTVIEQYENGREEMKASSEEMQSTNEELRSTMEELETSKEELQSINEELQTVNQQNRHKLEELAQLTGDLQNLMAATDIATLFLDRDFRILRFTPKLGDLFNIRVTDQGRPISDLTSRLGYPELSDDAKIVLNRLERVEREVQDEAGRWYLGRLMPYRSAEDRIQGVVITFIDIDTRRKAEQALRKSEDRLQRMVNVAGLSVLIFDKSGTIVDCNDAFFELSGYSRAEVSAKLLNWRNVTAEEYLPETERQFQLLAETGGINPYEKELILKDGSHRWMIVASVSLGDGTSAEYCFDVADRKKAEELVRRGDENLRNANRSLLRLNSDLKHFSYAVSHDMMEPLRMVMSYTQLLARDFVSTDKKALTYIRYAVDGAKQMEALLNGLREYWSVEHEESEELGQCAMEGVFQHTLEHLRDVIQSAGGVVTHDPLPTVMGQEYPLQLLFQNLIQNALKYKQPNTPPRIHVAAERDGHMFKFSITDNGIGIDPAETEVIFAPFKRLHPTKYPGTGLGLAMCQKVVERHLGRIWVRSIPGKGSTFYFTLPAAVRDEASSQDPH